MLKISGRAYEIAWKNHRLRWEQCTDCPLHKTTDRRVLVRGTFPSDILFIGESPEVIDSATGLPFTSPTGKLLDKLIEDTGMEFSYAATNIVACCAKGDEGEVRPPTNYEADKCSDRLYQVLMMSKPKAVILLGRGSQSLAVPVMEKYKYPFTHLNMSSLSHIMKAGGRESSAYQKDLKTLKQFLQRI